MWFLKNTFGIITLQIGVMSFSSVFITLAACVLLVNVLSLDIEDPMAWIIMFVFIFTMVIIWSIAFKGAYKELQCLISKATVMWAVYIVIWNVLVIWSFIQQNKNICIEARCPNALWLMNNSWYELKHIAIEKNKANNEVIETSMTPENQRNLISSVTLTILYTIIILYSWMILFSFRKEIQQKKNLETQ